MEHRPKKHHVSVSGVLKYLGVSRSGYIAWLKRIPSDAQRRREYIKEKILDNLENLIMEHMEKTITYLGTLEIKDNEGIVDRLSRKIAIITATAELANKAFEFNMNVDNIRQYLSNVCVENINTFDELNEDTFNFKATYEKFLESIAEVAETKPEHTNVLFVSSKDFKKHSQQIIDNVDVIKNMK